MEIETDRLLLREFKKADWRRVQEYQSDPLYLRFYPWEHRGEGDVRQFVQMFIDYQHEHPRHKYQLAVVLKSEGRLIGNCGVRVNDPWNQEANIGYELDSRYWGQGYATEAANAILRFGFQTLGIHRIWAECVAENTASARVLEKLGMQLEGREREKVWIKGRWHDHLKYAILEYEWSSRSML